MTDRILVTAGPTREPIDPIRFLSNRSTGKMGFSIAEVAAERGHQVRLIAGPVGLSTPPGVERIDVITAEEMHQAVASHFKWCKVLLMVAAVSDWRPATVSPKKLKKHNEEESLRLVRTRDVLSSIKARKGERIVVGFAAESDHVEAEAVRKLNDKNLDMIVCNDVLQPDAAFESDTNRVVIFTRDGAREALPLLLKKEVAVHILSRVEHEFMDV